METPAKSSPPSPEGIFPRKRLFHRLDQTRTRPVIFITAPPGSGKTSLVTSYLKDRKLPCLWYQVDEGDADAASFFYHMGNAAKRAASSRRKPLPLLTPEYLMGIKTFTLRFFEDLYGRLLHEKAKRRTGEPEKGRFVIVLDNYQEAPEDSPFQEVIQNGLSRIPAGIAVIILSRSEPPQGFAYMEANRLMEVIGWDELRLQYDETKGIIRQLWQERFSDEILHRVHSKADGWAAGLVLIAERGKTGFLEPLSQEAQTPKEIFNYFAGEILQKTPAETQALLQKTSFFRKFTAEMAEKLANNPQAARTLSDLNKKNYFTQKHASRPPVYEYHNLFREFLLLKAHEAFHSDEFSQIRHDAARICEDTAQSEDAIELFLEGEAWNDATKLILKQAPVMMTQGRGMTLSGWIEALPEATVRDSPYLLYWKGICHLPFSPPQGREYLEKAFHLFEARQDAMGAFLAWCGMVNSFLSEWDDFTPLDPRIEWLDKRLSDGSTPPPLVYPQVAVSMIWALTFEDLYPRPIRDRER